MGVWWVFRISLILCLASCRRHAVSLQAVQMETVEEDTMNVDSMNGENPWGNKATMETVKMAPKGGADGSATVAKKERKSSAPEYTSGPRSWFSIMTWNVENMGVSSSPEHKEYIKAALTQLVKDHRPDIIVLQEIETCNLVDMGYLHRYGHYQCVGSVIPARLEQKTSIVLGNILIYRADLFVTISSNKVLSSGYAQAARHHDRNGETLNDHHARDCSWAAYNGCTNPRSDMPQANSVTLMFQQTAWNANVHTAFPGGLRVVNIHLFSGVKAKLTNTSRADRRAFQLRSLFALTDHWNTALPSGSTPPTTLYAGDYNTRGPHELRRLTQSAMDYGVDMWCPSDGGLCSHVSSQKKTHRGGFLDNVLVDIQPRGSHARLGAWGLILDQPSGPGEKSDHNPLLLKLGAPEVEDEPQTEEFGAEDFPSIGETDFPSIGATKAETATDKPRNGSGKEGDGADEKAPIAAEATIEDEKVEKAVMSWSERARSAVVKDEVLLMDSDKGD